jgi:hypothetical protein
VTFTGTSLVVTVAAWSSLLSKYATVETETMTASGVLRVAIPACDALFIGVAATTVDDYVIAARLSDSVTGGIGKDGAPGADGDSVLELQVDGGILVADSGGDTRGEYAVDLQTVRTSVEQVASGDYSVIGGGDSNTASGSLSTVGGGDTNTASGAESAVGGGYKNTASGTLSTIGGGENNKASGWYNTVAGGKNNLASGAYGWATVGGGESNKATVNYGTVAGGLGNTASALYSTVVGGWQAVADKYGQVAHAAGGFFDDGDAQTSVLVARKITSNDTPAELFLDRTSARCTIGSDTTWAFSILVVARGTDADNESAAYKFEGCIDNNAGTTALVGSVTKTVLAEDTAGWDCDVTADNTNDALVITATGENDKTIYWVARITLVEVTG